MRPARKTSELYRVVAVRRESWALCKAFGEREGLPICGVIEEAVAWWCGAYGPVAQGQVVRSGQGRGSTAAPVVRMPAFFRGGGRDDRHEELPRAGPGTGGRGGFVLPDARHRNRTGYRRDHGWVSHAKPKRPLIAGTAADKRRRHPRDAFGRFLPCGGHVPDDVGF